MSADVATAVEDAMHSQEATLFVVATGAQADALNQVLPLYHRATCPTRLSTGYRFERVVVMIPIPAADRRLQDWFQSTILTRLTPAGTLEMLAA